MGERLKILHLEDDLADAELIQAALEADGLDCFIWQVRSRPDFVSAVEQGGFDVILSDHDLPGFDGFTALKLARQRRPEVPFIMVTGVLGEDQAVEALKHGVTDYVLKTRLGRLVPAMQRALREAQEASARQQAQAMLEMRARQQATIARLGLRALAGGSLPDVMDAVVGQVADTMGVEFCQVLELQPDGAALRVVAGVGWAEGTIGQTLVRAAPDSQAGFALQFDSPVIVTNFASETRFQGMRLLRAHDVVSGMTVVIPGKPRPFGVLGTYTAQQRLFTQDDANFLQAAANLLAEAIARWRAEEQLTQQAERLKLLAEASQAFAEAGPDYQAVLEIMTRKVADTIGDACTVRLLSEDGKTLPVAAESHRNPQALALIREISSRSVPASDEGAAGRVVSTGQPVVATLVGDQIRASVAPAWWPYWEQFGVHSLLAVPLQAQGRVIGVLVATRDQTAQPYNAEEQRLLQDLADRATLAVDNGRLYHAERQARQDTQRAAGRTSRMQAVTAALSRALTPLQVAEVIVVQGTAALGGQAGQVLRLGEDGSTIEALHAAGYPPSYAARFSRFQISDNLPSADVVRSGEALWIASQAEFALRYPQVAARRPPGLLEGLAVAPLCFEGRILGTLVISFERVMDFGDEDRRLLTALADLCAQALERARLYIEAQALNTQLEERVRSRTAELEESREQLRRLSAWLEEVREVERARIAREVHDGIGQQLSGLKMDAAWLQAHLQHDQTALAEKARDMAALLDETIGAVRQITTDLRPGLLDDFGLVAAIEWQARDFEKRHGIRCRFTSEVADIQLAPASATAVFRVFQDTLSNVSSHAQATEVSVSLMAQPGYLVLSVHDNARGASPAEVTNMESLGLVGMRERIYRLSGEFRIDSTPGQGTTVLIKIPLPA